MNNLGNLNKIKIAQIVLFSFIHFIPLPIAHINAVIVIITVSFHAVYVLIFIASCSCFIFPVSFPEFIIANIPRTSQLSVSISVGKIAVFKYSSYFAVSVFFRITVIVFYYRLFFITSAHIGNYPPFRVITRHQI